MQRTIIRPEHWIQGNKEQAAFPRRERGHYKQGVIGYRKKCHTPMVVVLLKHWKMSERQVILMKTPDSAHTKETDINGIRTETGKIQRPPGKAA